MIMDTIKAFCGKESYDELAIHDENSDKLNSAFF